MKKTEVCLNCGMRLFRMRSPLTDREIWKHREGSKYSCQIVSGEVNWPTPALGVAVLRGEES